MKILAIEWGDAFIDVDDFKIEDALTVKPEYRTTVGFLIAKNQHGYILATDKYKDPEAGVSGKMFIPHGMITHIREIK